jgi:hypothetical protein
MELIFIIIAIAIILVWNFCYENTQQSETNSRIMKSGSTIKCYWCGNEMYIANRDICGMDRIANTPVLFSPINGNESIRHDSNYNTHCNNCKQIVNVVEIIKNYWR